MTNKLTLDIIKQMIADGVLKQNIAEEYFPELAESEDEMIRKECISIIKEYERICIKEGDACEVAPLCIAWLEKQGEQNPANKEYTFKAIPRLLEMIQPTDRAKSYCQKLIDSLEQEGYITDAKIVSDCLKQMNGEKVAMATMDEQKPAWSEEDEEIHRKCICAMKASACGFPEEEKFVEQVDNWLKSLKDRLQSQPKQ